MAALCLNLDMKFEAPQPRRKSVRPPPGGNTSLAFDKQLVGSAPPTSARRSLRGPPGGTDSILFADEFTSNADFGKQTSYTKDSPIPKTHFLPADVAPSPPKFKYPLRRPHRSCNSPDHTSVPVLMDHENPKNTLEIKPKKNNRLVSKDTIGPQGLDRNPNPKPMKFGKARVTNAIGSVDTIGPQCLDRSSGPVTPKSGRARATHIGGVDSIGPQCLQRTEAAPEYKPRMTNKKNQEHQDTIEFCLNRADQPVMRKGRVAGACGGETTIGDCFKHA